MIQNRPRVLSPAVRGDDVDATRDRSAAYLELQVGLPANVEFSAAVRYERYEQEGTLTGPQGKSLIHRPSMPWCLSLV